MDINQVKNLAEAYQGVYEQSIGVPLKDASDRAAKKQLEKMIPKGEKVHMPKTALQNAGFEPEGDEISEDAYDEVLNLLLDEGFSEKDAVAIMATMTESVLSEMSDFEAGGGNAKMKQGMSRSEVEALGKKNLAKSSNKSSEKSQTTPSDVVLQRLKDTKDLRDLQMKAMAAGKSKVGYLKSLAAKEQEKAYDDYMAKKPQKTYASGRDAWNDLAG
jgi:hypothetical protein